MIQLNQLSVQYWRRISVSLKHQTNLDHTVTNDNYHVKKTWVMSKGYTNIYPCDCVCL